MSARRPGDATSRYAVLLAALALAASTPTVTADTQIGNPNNDLNAVRTSLGASEGYLNFRTTDHGEEYTGHTDKDGRDWSDNWITVKPYVVKDSANAGPTNANAAAINNDFEYARKIYAQAGFSVRRESDGEVKLAYTWADFRDADKTALAQIDFYKKVSAAGNRSANGTTINLYYVRQFAQEDSTGRSLQPRNQQWFGDPVNFQLLAHSAVQDTRSNNTVAHELGHLMLNADALWSEDGTAPSESSDQSNLMFVTTGGAAENLGQVGPKLSATVGGRAIIEPRKDNTTNGVQLARLHGNLGGGGTNQQGNAIAHPGYARHANYHDTHGDRADFDWVGDHRAISRMAGGSNGADHRDGEDYMVWEINPTQASTHKGPDADNHDHGALANEVLKNGAGQAMPDFGGQFFKIVDVISNVNAYADNDTAGGALSDRAKALDYDPPEFSKDGTTWQAGTLVSIFKKGWTEATTMEDWVARWSTTIEAKFLRLRAIDVGEATGHDGNAQIDAIIAAVPEPTTLALLALGGAAVLRRRRA